MAGWALKATMPTAVAYPEVTARNSDGKVYALGGTPATGETTAAHRSYDPVTNTWTTLASFPVSSRKGMCYENAGTVNFAFGSYDPNDGGLFGHNAILTAYKYTISTNSWASVATNPGGARAGGSCHWNGGDYIYWIGGAGYLGLGSTWYQNSLRYSISGDSWTTLGSLSYDADFTGVAFVSGTLFHAKYYEAYSGTYYGLLDVSTGSWTYYSGSMVATDFSDPDTTIPNASPVKGVRDGYIWYTASPYTTNKIEFVRLVASPYTSYRAGPRTAQPASSVTERSPLISGDYLYSIAGTSNPDTDARTGRVDQYDMDFPNAPTGITPAEGATVNNDLLTLGATVVANGEQVRVEWQIARDAAFTVNLRSIVDHVQTGTNYYGQPVFGARWLDSGMVTRKVLAGAEELFQGTWYIRCRVRNEPDSSPWSATQTFTVVHPPAVSLRSPVGGVALLFGASGNLTFQWAFSDTSETDYQTAYQLIAERSDTGALLLDTGKILSQTARSYPWSLPAASKDVTIRWKMRAWDSDDVAGPYTSYSIFTMSDAPVVNVTDPAEGAEVTNGTPTVSWTFAASGGRTQGSYRVRFYTGDSGTLVYDTGVVASSALTFTPSEQAVGVGSFVVRVDVTDGGGLGAFDTNNFTTSYDTPAEPGFSVSASQYGASGYIHVAWTNAEKDYAWVSYRVYRRILGDTAWTLMESTTAVQSEYDYFDYTAGSGVLYEYIVVQAGDRFGQDVESAKTNPQAASGTSEDYWLVDNDFPERNILLSNVSADDFSDEWEEETLEVIGRGRHKDYGTRFGYTGGLTASFHGPAAREKRLALEELKYNRAVMLLRNPFGDVWQVSLGGIQIKRIPGTGMYESVEVQVPYEEVS